MQKEQQLQDLVNVVAELFNAVADLAEGSQFMAHQRLNAISPKLKELLDDLNSLK